MVKGISETEFASEVEDLLNRFHWRWCHFRPAWSSKGYRTPIRGGDPDGYKGKGFPDYIAVRPPRLLFIELKDNYRDMTVEQDAWLQDLKECAKLITLAPVRRGNPLTYNTANKAKGILLPEVYLWRPSDLEPNGGKIVEILK